MTIASVSRGTRWLPLQMPHRPDESIPDPTEYDDKSGSLRASLLRAGSNVSLSRDPRIEVELNQARSEAVQLEASFDRRFVVTAMFEASVGISSRSRQNGCDYNT